MQRYTRTRLQSAAVIVLGISCSVRGVAQERQTLEIDEFVIEGNVQKPEAFFILPRTAQKIDELDQRANLEDEIIKAVQFEPF